MGHPPVNLEIRYEEGPAEQVVLVWGLNGWLPPPAAAHPEGSTLRRRVLHSPMARDGDAHRLVLQVPLGSRVDYGFLVTPAGDPAAGAVWSEPPGGEGVVALRDGVVVHGGAARVPVTRWWCHAAWLAGALACGVVALFVRRRGLPREAFLDIDPSRAGVAKISAALAVAAVAILVGAWVFTRVGMEDHGEVSAELRAALAVFDPWIEAGLPAWYSAGLMVLAAVTCVVCFLLDQARGTGRLGGWLCWGWLVMAAGFMMMSAASPASWVDAGSAGFGYLGWPGKVIAVAALLVLLLFGTHLRRDRLPAVLMLLGTACFLVPVMLAGAGSGEVPTFREVLLGRWGEMAGSLAFAVAALAYLSRGGGFRVHFDLSHAWIGVTVVTGAFVLVWIAAHGGVPGIEVPVARAWFPATLGVIAAILGHHLSRGYRSLGDGPRARVYLGWMWAALIVSAAAGIGLREWAGGTGWAWLVDLVLAGVTGVVAVAGSLMAGRPALGLASAAWLVVLGEAYLRRDGWSGWGSMLHAVGLVGLLVAPVAQLSAALLGRVR